MKKTKIEMVPVNSSNIAAIGYSEKLLTLHVEFHTGAVYRYYPVPKITYDELMGAESIGGYFAKNIKSNKSITYERL